MDGEGGSRLGWGDWLAARRVAREAGVPEECVEAEACMVGSVLVSIDGYSASESRPPWLSWRDWGWRATVASASDVVAAGGIPEAVMVSVGAPNLRVANEIVGGVGEAAGVIGAVVAGGDLNKCLCDAWIDVAVIGRPVKWIKRVGGGPGDFIVQVGLAGVGAVVRALLEGLAEPKEAPQSLLEAYRRPSLPLDFPDIVGVCGAKASIDNSDGWLYSIAQLAKVNGVAARVDDVLAYREAVEFLEKLGVNAELWIAQSWEDYNIAVIADDDTSSCIIRECRRRGLPCAVVGELVEGEAGMVWFKGVKVEPEGWGRGWGGSA